MREHQVPVRSALFRLALLALFAVALSVRPHGEEPPPSIRITSPLGRIGSFTNLRIVAQVISAPGVVIEAVRFYVDGQLYKTVSDGPPYAVEWVDENPFEQRELAVDVTDQLGRIARDGLTLEPFEITEIADVRSVLLEAGIYDDRGRFVRGLSPSNFVVHEDGVPQTIDLARHEALPATFALLVDSSQSMHRRIDYVREAASRLVDFLRPADRVLVAPFTRALSAVTGPTSDRRTILEAIGRIEASGGTAIVDSLVEMVRKLPPNEARRVIVLVTDGYDEKSAAPLDEAVAALKETGVTVYVVAIGGVAGVSLKGERLLRRIALETGGQFFSPTREEELVAVHARLAGDAQNRYLVTYTPANQARDGKWRDVTFATTPAYLVRTRAGYTAPAPPPIRPELEFTITDTDRHHVDLSAADLVVVEDGVEQKIEAFHEATAPVSIILALDASGSMRRAAGPVVEAAQEFVATLRPQDGLGLLLFADRSVFAHDLSTVRDATIKTIESYTALGGTALYDGLWDALTRLQRVEGRRAIVVLSDGRDEDNPGTGPGSVKTAQEVFDSIRQADTAIFPIGLGPNVDRAFLERLAEESGGEAYFPEAVDKLRDDYRRVVESLRRRYVLSYTSTNRDRNGAWRDVEIRSRMRSVVVTSRGGYFAPER
jgi:Ca-activated chloride channel family protein